MRCQRADPDPNVEPHLSSNARNAPSAQQATPGDASASANCPSTTVGDQLRDHSGGLDLHEVLRRKMRVEASECNLDQNQQDR
jgi:hypothetical protein